MRRFILPAALAATLAFVAPSPAKAQVILGGYPSYYGGYSPYGYGSGSLLQLGLNLAFGLGGYGGYGYYPGYYGSYGGWGGYGYSPRYYSGWGGYGLRSYGYPSYYRGGYGYRGYGGYRGHHGHGRWHR